MAIADCRFLIVDVKTRKERQLLMVSVNEPDDGDWIASTFLRCLEAQADDSVTLDAVRSALAKIPGSMVDNFCAERDERVSI